MHQKMLQEKEQGQNDEEAKDDTKNGQRRTPAAKKDQPAKNNSAAKTPINEDSAGSDDGLGGLGKESNKRTKERSIEEIIQKVSLWRKLYNGVLKDGNLVRYSLEDAA